MHTAVATGIFKILITWIWQKKKTYSFFKSNWCHDLFNGDEDRRRCKQGLEPCSLMWYNGICSLMLFVGNSMNYPVFGLIYPETAEHVIWIAKWKVMVTGLLIELASIDGIVKQWVYGERRDFYEM